MAALIGLECSAFSYPDKAGRALGRVSLRVPAGGSVCVVGGAASGKTTTARLLAGHLPGHGNFSGRLQLDGAELVFGGSAEDPRINFAEWSRVVGFVGQRPRAQLSGVKDTVAEELIFGLENRAVPPAAMRRELDRVAGLLGIGTLLQKPPTSLSGGELQKVVIAATVINGPRVLVLDEPMAGLDAVARASLTELLDVLVGQGLALAVFEQGLDGYAQHSERVVVLDAGSAVLEGSWREVAVSGLLPSLPVKANPYAELARTCAAGFGDPPVTGSAGLPLTEQEAVRYLAGLPRASTAPSVRDGASSSAIPVEDGAEPLAVLRNVVFRYPRLPSPWTLSSGPVPPPAREAPIGAPASAAPAGAALDSVSMDLRRGERTAIIGANGAGKTTLLRHLNGLAVPQEGRVKVGGMTTANHPVGELARRVGFLFQDADSQLFERTVQREVEFGPRNRGLRRPEAAHRAADALERCGLGNVAAEHPFEVSFSDRRLVALASILAVGPDLLALDEPTVALDKAGLALLSRLTAREAAAGRAVVMVTHDVDFAVANCDRLVVLEAGRVLCDGPVTHVLRRLFPPEPLTAEPPSRQHPRTRQVAGVAEPRLWRLAGLLGLSPAELTVEGFRAALVPGAAVDSGS